MSTSAEETIRVGLTYFPPYSQVVEGECRGIYCEIANQVFTEELGIAVIAVQHPWARIQREVELGNIDVMFAMPSEPRKRYGFVSDEPIFLNTMKVFTYIDHPRLAEIKQIRVEEDIKALNLTAITNQGNAWHSSHIESLGITTVHAISDEHILKMLAAKRGDLVIDTSASMRYMMEDMALTDKFLETDAVIDRANIHIILSKKSKFSSRMPEIDEVTINRIRGDNHKTNKCRAELISNSRKLLAIRIKDGCYVEPRTPHIVAFNFPAAHKLWHQQHSHLR